MRSVFSFAHFTVIVVVPLALMGACGGSEAMATFSGEGDAQEQPTAGDPKGSLSDAGAPTISQAKVGLCGATDEECVPDNDRPTATDTCATPPDAGGAPESFRGCRLTKEDGGFVPRCGPADARGVDGTPCAKGSDCAPGFDCIEEEKTPVCRRYCCSGSCENQLSLNGGPTFCDIRKLANLDQRMAPVCMPIKTCKLLRAGDCGDKETCAIVTEKGDTGCVPTGNAKVDEPCDVTHCDKNLTCLGIPGERRCFQLCRVDGSDCGPTKTCTTGSVFQDTAFGVCKKD